MKTYCQYSLRHLLSWLSYLFQPGVRGRILPLLDQSIQLIHLTAGEKFEIPVVGAVVDYLFNARRTRILCTSPLSYGLYHPPHSSVERT